MFRLVLESVVQQQLSSMVHKAEDLASPGESILAFIVDGPCKAELSTHYYCFFHPPHVKNPDMSNSS